MPGMVIGVPTFAVIYALCRRWINRNLAKKKLPTETEEYKELAELMKRAKSSFLVIRLRNLKKSSLRKTNKIEQEKQSP